MIHVVQSFCAALALSSVAGAASTRAGSALQLGNGSDRAPPSNQEGALANDTFLPVSPAAEAKLAAGDAALARARAIGASDATGPHNEAFDAWRAALVETTPGDAVSGVIESGDAGADVDGTLARRTEAVECAVLRRVGALDDESVRAWRERFGELAQRELSACGTQLARLARVEREHPFSVAAAHAAVRAFDLEFETGRGAAALAWLARAEVHAHGLERSGARGEASEVLTAVARRRSTLAPTPPTDVEAWTTADRLTRIATYPLGEEIDAAVQGRGPRPGLAFLHDGSVVVQTADRVHCIASDGSRKSFDPVQLAGNVGWRFAPIVGRRAAEWPIVPASDGVRVVLVAGRVERDQGNALLCIDPGSSQRAPALVWGYAAAGSRSPSGRAAPLSDSLGPGLWSFEPGPAIVGTDVVVQARQWTADGDDPAFVDESRANAWCVALDLDSGAVRWKRLLATGADANAESRIVSRLRASRGIVGWAQPIGVLEGRAFVGTELGVGALLDLCDGRPVWSLRSQRRDHEERGWRTSRAPIAAAPDALRRASWVWTPADSTFLYRLRTGPDVDGRGVFLHRPHPIGEMEELAGAGPGDVLALARAAGRRALARIDAGSGRREDAFLLGREEYFTGAALASAQRVLFATNRALYLVDSARELYLLDAAPLESTSKSPGGSVFGRGAHVYLLGTRSLSVYRCE